MKTKVLTLFVAFFLGGQSLAKPAAPNSLLTRGGQCPPRGAVVESCFMCADKKWEKCGPPDEKTGQRICYCTTCKYACYLDLVNKREPEAVAAPQYEPKPEYKRVPAPLGDEVCPPSTTVVESCSECKYGFINKLACRQGSTGLECRCDVCLNYCTYDGREKREAEPAPEPVAEAVPEPQSTSKCSQLTFVQSCSKCPYGFDPKTCKPGSSGPKECTCTRCNYACQNDASYKREPVPPPEVICPAEGSPVQDCGLCRSGYDRCNSSTGLCQCKFCDGPSSFCKGSSK